MIAIVVPLAVLPGLSQGIGSQRPASVSMLQLIATPERFDGRLVSVVAFLTLGREDDYLYPYEADAVHFIDMDGIGVQRTERMTLNATSLNRKYVKLVGVFKRADKDQLVIGIITDVKSCEIWSDPNMPISKQLRHIPGIAPSSRE